MGSPLLNAWCAMLARMGSHVGFTSSMPHLPNFLENMSVASSNVILAGDFNWSCQTEWNSICINWHCSHYGFTQICRWCHTCFRKYPSLDFFTAVWKLHCWSGNWFSANTVSDHYPALKQIKHGKAQPSCSYLRIGKKTKIMLLISVETLKVCIHLTCPRLVLMNSFMFLTVS